MTAPSFYDVPATAPWAIAPDTFLIPNLARPCPAPRG